jgi:hypothetical protein
VYAPLAQELLKTVSHAAPMQRSTRANAFSHAHLQWLLMPVCARIVILYANSAQYTLQTVPNVTPPLLFLTFTILHASTIAHQHISKM